MKTRIVFTNALICALTTCCNANQEQQELWYTQPAKNWEEALPIGNGRLGAMIYGNPRNEHLQLNDITIWSGGIEPNADIADAYTHLPEIRSAIASKDYKLAERLTNKYMVCSNKDGFDGIYFSSYQTLGNLDISFDLPTDSITAYKRWLNIANAVAGMSFAVGGKTYMREYIASHPDSVIAIRLTSSDRASLSFSMSISREHSAVVTAQDSALLIMRGNTDYKGKKGNCDYEAQVRVVTRSGRIVAKDNRLYVQNADEAYIYIVCGTSYVLNQDMQYRKKIVSADISKGLTAAAAKGFPALKDRHIEDYRTLMDRMSLRLGSTSRHDLPTDERIKRFGDGTADAALAALFYQYGRYLLISCSREDNPLPANLQGLWGDGYELPWHCDYHTNINYQMNYWAAEASNLAECRAPALRLNKSLVRNGERTAKSYFNAPGWTFNMQTNVWGWTSPGWWALWGMFFGGSGWLAQDYWEHYAYTQDDEYLRSVYSIMKSACEFYLAAMTKNADGYWVMSPSSSPENYYVANGVRTYVTEGSTMEMSIIRDLFNNTIAAARILGMDEEFSAILRQTKEQILPFRIGGAGQLQEWADDVDMTAPDIHHRHVSHLFALHPGKEISPIATPDLARAARRTLEIRGDGGTGWSLAWKINFWARLLDGNRAYKLMTDLLRYIEPSGKIAMDGGGVYPNLFDAHPPFQIDGNFGFLSGLNEMLLQSHRTYTDPAYPNDIFFIADLLPALPVAWQSGKINGLCSRGGFVFNIEWADGKLKYADVKSTSGTRLKVVYHGKEVELKMQQGDTTTLLVSNF